MWLLYTLPMGQNRSKEEVRARTLVGALESLRCGITTVQDMLGLVPLDDAIHRRRDRRLSRGRHSRRVLADGVGRPADRDGPPQGQPAARRAGDAGHHRSADPRPARLSRAPVQAPSGRRHAALGDRAVRAAALHAEDAGRLRRARAQARSAVYTHVYETRGQVLIARELFGASRRLADQLSRAAPACSGRGSTSCTACGSRGREMDRMAAADAGIVLNHLSNLKLKSGIAPVCDLREAGVRLGLGCDNCSGSDVQSVFQAMKMFCLLAAVSEPEPGPALAHEVLAPRDARQCAHRRPRRQARRHPAGLQGRPDPHRSQRRRLSALQQRRAPARLHRSRPRRRKRDRRRPRGDEGAQGHDHRRGRAAPRGRRPHAPLHRRLRRRGRIAQARAALHAARRTGGCGRPISA